MRGWGELKSLRGQSVGEVRLVMRAIFRICGNESQPGLQMDEKLAMPLPILPKLYGEAKWTKAREDSHHVKISFATLGTRKELEKKSVPQLLLGSLLRTHAPVSYWPIFFPVPSNSPRSLCRSQLAPFSFSFLKWRINFRNCQSTSARSILMLDISLAAIVIAVCNKACTIHHKASGRRWITCVNQILIFLQGRAPALKAGGRT